MKAQRMILHVLAVAGLGAMCMAQSNTGAQGRNQRDPQGIAEQRIGEGPDSPGSMSSNSDMKSPDHMFIMKAAQGGMAEVQLGNLAKQNGGSDAVKQFGDKMVTDHSQANNELRQLTQQKGITLPSDISSKDKAMTKMLASKQGADFDKAYVHDMVKDHETDVAEFRHEAENGKDPEVKAWAQKTLPVLEQHLAAVKQVASQLGVDTGKTKSQAMSSQQ
jgi:putative membrane protein